MPNPFTERAASGRDDFSPFVVHLTRNDIGEFSDGATASENLQIILREKRVCAVRPHCIYNKEIAELGEEVAKICRVACFTEVPLSQIHRLTGVVAGRSTKLDAYGLVFRKDRLIAAGAQPAIYVNSYGGNNHLKEAYREMFTEAKKDIKSKFWRILPLLNVMHEKHDFSWEREWRISNEFNFTVPDIVCVILPNTGEEELRELATEAGVAVISPGLNYEQIIMELSTQQRTTKTKATAK